MSAKSKKSVKSAKPQKVAEVAKPQKKKSSIELPFLPMRETVVFPSMTCPFFIGRHQSLEALEHALNNDRRLMVVSQKNSGKENPGLSDIYSVGTVGKVLQVMKMPNRTVKILFEAEYRATVVSAIFDGSYYKATVRRLESVSSAKNAAQIKSLMKMIKKSLHQYFRKDNRNIELINSIKEENFSPESLVDRIAPFLDNIDLEKKQALLENTNVLSRLEYLYKNLIEEEENKKLEGKIKHRIQTQIGKTHREYYLNEQMKAIQKELGNEEGKTEMTEYEKKITELKLSPEAKEIAEKEIKRLDMLPPYSSEANIVRNYLDWLFSVPWNNDTKDDFDLAKATKILDEDHYGLEQIKERILEFLAVTKNLGKIKGPIICLVGSPGVGKTSLAKSVARSLNRNFVRISLGGVRDEAEIRGHRRTYIGAMPGKIIQMMKKAKSSNPLILLDEIDKVSRSYMGDPAAALLEVLDPEQNHAFMDHYLEVEYDLSKALFLCTANNAGDIPPALYDRMEVITISGYTEIEKIEITKRHLIPKQMKENGLKSAKLQFRKESLPDIIRYYTREAGIRNLEREIGKVCRKSLTELMRNETKKSIVISPKKVREFLGVHKFHFGSNLDNNEIGVATGLAWTGYGGDVLYIEVTEMRGKGDIRLTGKLGDVMKESATAAMSYVRSNANSLGIYSDVFQNRDIHVHVPEGATPKDGPSAGITLATAIVSLLTGIPVRKSVAMTGEITLRGKVLQIGGLKEKLLAAKRSGIDEIIIPAENQKHLEDIPDEVKKSLVVRPVKTVGAVFGIALERMPTSVDDKDLKEEKNTSDPSYIPTNVFNDDTKPATQNH